MRNPRRVSPAEPLERMRYAMKLIISLAATAALAGGLATLPAPALAQQAGSQSEVVVYGSDPCPRSTESNIVVCVHRPETERYRLPKSQQLLGTRQERQAWSNRAREISISARPALTAVRPSVRAATRAA